MRPALVQGVFFSIPERIHISGSGEYIGPAQDFQASISKKAHKVIHSHISHLGTYRSILW